jgi:hypothetical protein
MLCGYGAPWGHINTYLATPDNSLTLWGDHGGLNILADYGAAALFAIYLNDQFGEDFISNYMLAGEPGYDGLNAALAPFGKDFEKVYRNWRIANLVNHNHGPYSYSSLDLDDPEAADLRVYEVEYLPVPLTTGNEFGTTITGYGGGIDLGFSELSAYGSDYIEFTEWSAQRYMRKFLTFDGEDGVRDLPNNWEYTELGWYSGMGDLINDLLVATATVTDPTLTITTYWDIEDYWDFGFVQVSTDGGDTWTSLENEYTTYLHDSGAHPDATDNLPGLTGWSGDFVTMDFDLTAYLGMDVLIGFRFVTDWNTHYEGWYIQSAMIDGVELDLGPNIITVDTDWLVSVVYKLKIKKHEFYFPLWRDLSLDDLTEEGGKHIFASKPGSVILVVSPLDVSGMFDYSFKVDTSKWKYK